MSEKILFVDNNKMLCKLLAKKIGNDLPGYEVDIASSFAEVKDLVQNKYFLGFVDITLPDAPDGELVDFMVEKKIPTIVLTANNDEAIREKFMEKDVLDYIFKESETCIDEILDSIVRLKHYAKTKVILAMSKLPERNQVKKYLTQRLFDVMAAAHGEEALSYLNDSPDTRLVIADVQMPVLDGASLLAEVRARYGYNELGVMLFGDRNDALEASLLRNGLNAYLIKPLHKELFNHYLDRCLVYMDNMKLLNSYNDIDSVSGIRNHDALIASIEDYFNELATKKTQEEFAFAFLDIDELKTINDEHGYDVGDKVIKICASESTNEIKGRDIIGRYSPEKICIVLKNINHKKAIKIFSRIRVNIKNTGFLVNLDEIFFTVSIGVVFAKTGDRLEDLVNKATSALSRAKVDGKDRVEICS